ncbi:MAG: cyclic-phosphate processing receiver domain-containing protein [Methylocystis sp.]|uniref:cyclic-phosphate processing receiver domain-containing protein n=1 Tax=Methylocystis sp. TaxID=1911079 RepID=UPI003DA2EDB3
MSGSLWVDDCKPAPDGCAVARNYDDALRLLRRFDYDTLYLDHDLGDHHRPERTGYDLLKQLIADNRVPARVECISWNPVGVKRINNLLAQFRPIPAPEKDNG